VVGLSFLKGFIVFSNHLPELCRERLHIILDGSRAPAPGKRVDRLPGAGYRVSLGYG
tara:strand:- start:93 stop:263 length:171 start_codon:yes stop_codon:yes gene_type:complete